MIILLFVALVAGCSKYPFDTESQFKGDDYSLAYPPEWVVQDNGIFVYFKTPLEDDSDKLQENVVVYTTPLESKDQDLTSFFQQSVQALIDTTKGFTLIAHEETTLSSEPAQKIVYTEDSEFGKIKYLQVFTIKDGNVYILTYTAPVETYDDHVAEAEQAISSFKIK
ncbi:MAG TPA: PsbP-related protein [Candidatus Nanoarchaeia archaeon]|nr:PsbP-related protein [Candidatus Nanoarchaeia archaeon]